MGTCNANGRLYWPDNFWPRKHLAVEFGSKFASCWSKVSGTIGILFEMDINRDIYMDYGNDYGWVLKNSYSRTRFLCRDSWKWQVSVLFVVFADWSENRTLLQNASKLYILRDCCSLPSLIRTQIKRFRSNCYAWSYVLLDNVCTVTNYSLVFHFDTLYRVDARHC